MTHAHAALSRCPLVTVILPTYNRARFLPQAFASIKAQTLTDWEIIVVDDGSSDETRAQVASLSADLRQPVHYVYQENQGPYGARNRGLDYAQRTYIAFFDSDDLWLPHHLADCVAALEKHPDVDWVYGACRIVDFATGTVLDPTTFYVDGQPRPFLHLRTRGGGPLRIIDDPQAIRSMILHGLYCGLQNSVFRRNVFTTRRFCAQFRNEAEDQVIVVRILAAGHHIGYLDNVHVIYHIHDANSSLAGVAGSIDKRLEVLKALIRGYEELPDQVTLTRSQRWALKQRLSRDYFWLLGYATLWQNNRRAEALAMFWRGLRLWPWEWRYWKTYLLAMLKTGLARWTA